ncbi:hypothetical protein J3Q64DRAFT_1695341 [Phycomyces blakesleeanus]|uniref:Uncharacterized protein n=1 Tax=Phycomyces blakesleeanus TaxID=4837 RepID=A0ABR3BA32_PHYBL
MSNTSQTDKNKDTDKLPDYEIYIYASGYQYAYTNGYYTSQNKQPDITNIMSKWFLPFGDLWQECPENKFNVSQGLAFQAIGSYIYPFHNYTHLQKLVWFSMPTRKSDLVNLIGYLRCSSRPQPLPFYVHQTHSQNVHKSS